MQHRMRQPSHLRNKSQSTLLVCKEHTGDLQNTSGNAIFPTGPLMALFEQQMLAMKNTFSTVACTLGQNIITLALEIAMTEGLGSKHYRKRCFQP